MSEDGSNAIRLVRIHRVSSPSLWFHDDERDWFRRFARASVVATCGRACVPAMAALRAAAHSPHTNRSNQRRSEFHPAIDFLRFSPKRASISRA